MSAAAFSLGIAMILFLVVGIRNACISFSGLPSSASPDKEAVKSIRLP
jgi:hypothetical protein